MIRANLDVLVGGGGSSASSKPAGFAHLDTRAEELREHRRIIAALTQRIPQLEAPQEPRDAPETASEDVGGTETPAGDTGEPRRSSWWRRFFGFE